MKRPLQWVAAGLICVALAGARTAKRFDCVITAARVCAAQGGVLTETRCGLIECLQAGAGVPPLAAANAQSAMDRQRERLNVNRGLGGGSIYSLREGGCNNSRHAITP